VNVEATNFGGLADRLFPEGHRLARDGGFVSGSATVDGRIVAVVGTLEHAALGVEIALRMAASILEVVREAPGRPIVMLVDTEGQRLRHRDELLGIHGYIAHLAKCVEMARQRGHAVVALVYDQALSGGFIATGMMADTCFALPWAEIRVMSLPAMARIIKVREERLRALSESSPVFAPGADNYLQMGALEQIWEGELGEPLAAALRRPASADRRAEQGLERGGRQAALPVSRRVRGYGRG
jgi:malonate decarboxylase gamma subunit